MEMESELNDIQLYNILTNILENENLEEEKKEIDIDDLIIKRETNKNKKCACGSEDLIIDDAGYVICEKCGNVLELTEDKNYDKYNEDKIDNSGYVKQLDTINCTNNGPILKGGNIDYKTRLYSRYGITSEYKNKSINNALSNIEHIFKNKLALLLDNMQMATKIIHNAMIFYKYIMKLKYKNNDMKKKKKGKGIIVRGQKKICFETACVFYGANILDEPMPITFKELANIYNEYIMKNTFKKITEENENMIEMAKNMAKIKVENESKIKENISKYTEEIVEQITAKCKNKYKNTEKIMNIIESILNDSYEDYGKKIFEDIKEILEKKLLKPTDITKGCKKFSDYLINGDITYDIKTVGIWDFIQRYKSKFNIDEKDLDKLKTMAENAKKIDLASDHQTISIAGALIMVLLEIGKTEIAEVFGNSSATIFKTYNEMIPYKNIILSNELTNIYYEKAKEGKLDEIKYMINKPKADEKKKKGRPPKKVENKI